MLAIKMWLLTVGCVIDEHVQRHSDSFFNDDVIEPPPVTFEDVTEDNMHTGIMERV